MIFVFLLVFGVSILGNVDGGINDKETMAITELLSNVELPEQNLSDLAHSPSPIFDADTSHDHKTHEHHGIQIVNFRWDYVKEPFMLTAFIIIIGIFKLAYHHTRYTRKLIPESCLLILLGVLFGFFFVGDETHASIKFLEFNSKIFFFYLLPPIILESAYSLKDRAFIDNFGTIVLYAVLGTVLNIVLIGGGLLFLGRIGAISGYDLAVLDTFVFASLIAAVDPVAVLAVFQEVGVNKMLYFMVFGESLLNDAVTIVCYNLANEFKEIPEFTLIDCLKGFAAFLSVSLGGLTIGMLCGAMTSFMTRYTENVRVVEPVFLFGMAYLSYIGAELFHFSGIIALITCGLLQSHYARYNISYKSSTCVTYFTKVISSSSESLIFIILGVMLVNEREWFWQDWHPTFSIWSVILCVVVRFAVTFGLTYIVNQFTGGVRYISFQEQCIMAYGGLRGAVSFSLAFMIESEAKNTILSATYMVILFTVFLQGSTMKFLVKVLKIGLAGKEEHNALFIEFNKGMIEHLSQGVEDLCGYKNYNWINQCSAFSKRFVRPILEKKYNERSRREGKLVELDRAFTMKEAMISSPSQSSFKRQQTFDEMAESGHIPMDLLDDDHHHIPTREEVDKKAEELTKDLTAVRKLMTDGDFFVDRNLTHEEEKEQKEKNKLQNLQSRAKKMWKEKKRSSVFGRKKSTRAKATQQGLLHSAIPTLGVHHSVSEDGQSSSARVSIEDEESGLTMSHNAEEHPLVTINENDEAKF
ncbi:unnamed protein product [Caenorhabditis angaria]|uniref:Sodium/hydrogen exchanger n=1 Tax=Caenorhabditis angaria TaxID=860376 RepID=A0A9P1J3E4_9PELO|nr:unnamed protein product [Caenorhabditis angaria]